MHSASLPRCVWVAIIYVCEMHANMWEAVAAACSSCIIQSCTSTQDRRDEFRCFRFFSFISLVLTIFLILRNIIQASGWFAHLCWDLIDNNTKFHTLHSFCLDRIRFERTNTFPSSGVSAALKNIMQTCLGVCRSADSYLPHFHWMNNDRIVGVLANWRISLGRILNDARCIYRLRRSKMTPFASNRLGSIIILLKAQETVASS